MELSIKGLDSSSQNNLTMTQSLDFLRDIKKKITYQMDGERELIHAGPLPPQVEDTDLGIRNTPEQK